MTKQLTLDSSGLSSLFLLQSASVVLVFFGFLLLLLFLLVGWWFVFETTSHFPKPALFLPLLLECWNYRRALGSRQVLIIQSQFALVWRVLSSLVPFSVFRLRSSHWTLSELCFPVPGRQHRTLLALSSLVGS